MSELLGSMDRRTVLRAAGVSATAGMLGTLIPGAAWAKNHYFHHGVASGDPLPDAVILWTRVTPTKDAVPGCDRGDDVAVTWQIATDNKFKRVVRHGKLTTGPDRDYTVKVFPQGLQADTVYWYRFSFDGKHSPVGRTRTAPEANVTPDKLRFGVVSCSNLESGYFSAYSHLANSVDNLDINAIIHLGDYIYEYAEGEYGPASSYGRSHTPSKATYSLADYRQRHAQYKSDPDLQKLHAAAPFIVTWDDHDLADDCWSGGTKDTPPEKFEARRAAAHKAYGEWMPTVDPTEYAIYRTLRFGTLMSLTMLDLRSFRSKRLSYSKFKHAKDSKRTITGAEQMAWLKDELNNEATWKMLGNSVMVAPLIAPGLPEAASKALRKIGLPPLGGTPLNLDQWDGFRQDRDGLFNHLYENKIENVTFLTGDIHTSWSAELPLDRKHSKSPRVGTEFICPSVTSESMYDLVKPHVNKGASNLTEAARQLIKRENRHFGYVNLKDHGFAVLSVTQQESNFDWYYIDDRSKTDTSLRIAANSRVGAGTSALYVQKY